MNSETFFINILYNRGNVVNNINKYLLTNSGNGFLKLCKFCFKNDHLKSVINYPAFYSNDFENAICDLIDLDKLGINKVALFISSLVNCQSDAINRFITLRDQFESELLFKQYEKALTTLICVYEQFGLSLWLIDAYSIVLNLFKSVEAKDELSHIRNSQFFKLFAIKNSLNIKHNYYIKQISETLNSSKLEQSYLNYLEYIFFVSIPNTKEKWHNILLYSTCFSFIDMYLCLVDYLQMAFCDNIKDPFVKKCVDSINCIHEARIDCICKEVYNFQKTDEECEKILFEFKSKKYNSVISHIYGQRNRLYNSVSMYLVVALSCLFSDTSICQTENSLFDVIIDLMYRVLKREDTIVDDILKLASISRALRIFTIHKGLCVFLDIVANFGFKYKLNEMYSTITDYSVKQYEETTDNIYLVPYLCKRKSINKDISDRFLELYKKTDVFNNLEQSKTYFREGYTILEYNSLISLGQTKEAISLFLNAYINNKILVFLVDVSSIETVIRNKIESGVELTIDELCYIFVDLYMEEYRDDCFLELFDSINAPLPIEVIKNASTTEEIKDFFLFEVCTTNRLSSLYFMFLSGEEAEDYRLKICNELLKNKCFKETKLALDEIERITKKRMLSKRIRKIDESKLLINADSLKEECRDSIIEKIDIYNNSSPLTYTLRTTKSNKFEILIIDNHRRILESIYSVYCKEFCFGNAGLDISLSTRVRHGTLTNQIIKVFSDHELLVDGNKLNDCLQKLMDNSEHKDELLKCIRRFNERVNNILEYFVKNTLKVFIDTPIEGAVFDYSYNDSEYENIFGNILSHTKIFLDEVASLMNYYIVDKTNKYLSIIRNKSLTELENSLLCELDNFSKTINDHFHRHDITRSLEGKIITCKTAIQNKLKSISNWFVLTEYNQWEAFGFSEIIQTCKEIDKNMFSGYDSVCINVRDDVNIKIEGKYFSEFVDIILIIFNNAIEHSGYRDDLSQLVIDCRFFEDSGYYCFSIANSLNKTINVNDLQKTIDRINDDFYHQKYLQLNVRQEGGMGIYKIMHIVFSILEIGEDFYISQCDNKFILKLKFKKEISE